ncbi:MAG TPA: hypothetical protein VN317_08090 [Candidatus Methanoperedens sp.]|nr:hypothetical protein [Candidatus Methanoperedens sp.]
MLIFHIGRPKTGSSAIQAFLDVNRAALAREHRILYPNLGAGALDEGEALNHSALIVHAAIGHAAERIAEAYRFAQRTGCEQLVISSESPHPRYVEIVAQVRRQLSAPVRVICYLRRQDHMVESYWKQWGIKSAAPDVATYVERMLQRLARGEPCELDYRHPLSLWARCVGAGALVVRSYEKSQLREKDVVADFLALIGVADRAGLRLPEENARTANRGFSPEAMAFLDLCRGSLGPLHDHRMFELFDEAFGEGGRKRPFESYRLLSPGLRLRILAACEPSNAEVAREFCGRADGRLFLEPWPRPDEPWAPVRLSPEDAGSMLFQVLVCQGRKLAQLKLGVKKVRARLEALAAAGAARP